MQWTTSVPSLLFSHRHRCCCWCCCCQSHCSPPPLQLLLDNATFLSPFPPPRRTTTTVQMVGGGDERRSSSATFERRCLPPPPPLSCQLLLFVVTASIASRGSTNAHTVLVSLHVVLGRCQRAAAATCRRRRHVTHLPFLPACPRRLPPAVPPPTHPRGDRRYHRSLPLHRTLQFISAIGGGASPPWPPYGSFQRLRSLLFLYCRHRHHRRRRRHVVLSPSPPLSAACPQPFPSSSSSPRGSPPTAWCRRLPPSAKSSPSSAKGFVVCSDATPLLGVCRFSSRRWGGRCRGGFFAEGRRHVVAGGGKGSERVEKGERERMGGRERRR